MIVSIKKNSYIFLLSLWNLCSNRKMRITAFILVSLIFIIYSGRESGKPLAIQDMNGPHVTSVETKTEPFFTGYSENTMIIFNIYVKDDGKPVSLKAIKIDFSSNSDVEDISGMQVLCRIQNTAKPQLRIISNFSLRRKKATITGPYHFANGENQFVINISLRDDADLNGKIRLEKLMIVLDDGSILPVTIPDIHEFRFAKILRAAGEDNCNTYRIPGLITTDRGTLIAVYDARYNNDKDLQEDIDIGMSRSLDCGQTWEPMKIIMDMDEYGGRPRKQNGTGDPCILYDHNTGTIWVAALWMSGAEGQTLWWTSKPGMKPEETGQFVIVKSTDDGKTWSEPFTITDQIKDPSWQLLFQGPGRGIEMTDGTLVFPAQFKADIGEKAIDGGQYTCYSTIVYSKDHGNSWHIGKGAKSNTTESQVVELSDRSLMLNMRDDRNRKDKGETNGRAVVTTKDMGLTWVQHPSSNHSLPEPNCMASLIATNMKIGGSVKKVLFFSNPDNKNSRSDMTIKASLDEGLTWPAEYQLRVNQNTGYGYSCLTMIDEKTIGILYEGVRELYFQKIPVKDILRELK